ncbi:MAG: (E)-4-hydroxy-3-methylbut-2-enyl-diphosphate synthase [Planctomycetales bacterium]|nr:(E)-4-hydroxy-3-methylbut-2-enyl-diphosphate synthase [Planctomycetales bacterium]
MKRATRAVRVGRVTIGGGAPVVVQSMCATRTQDVEATARQAQALHEAGAGVVRIAVDSDRDVAALAEVAKRTEANLSVDLQENYRLAATVAPHVRKIRYNPGHLHHHETTKPIPEKVKFLADVAARHDCAIRVGVNCGSVAPATLEKHPGDQLGAMVRSALDHCEMLDRHGFTRYVVSLKDSEPAKVVEANRRFAAERPDVPLHLGVTEAGLPPDGVIKTRLAFEKLLAEGIGETIRVSLTVPNDRKPEEVTVGRKILDDVAHRRFISVPEFGKGLNIISCPSCSRVENEAFVELAEKVKELTTYARKHKVTIAVMGCRVNGPGETDDADLGLWCGPTTVNLKRKSEKLGSFPYGEVLPRLKQELDGLIAERAAG